MTRLISFLKNHYHHLISLSIGALVAVITTLAYLDRESLELSFIIESTKKIVDLEGTTGMSDLSITYGDEKIKVLYVLELKIQNTGNKVILLDDLYEEKITIQTQDMTTKFITFDIDGSHNTACRFSRYEHFLYLNPDFLNPDDYINLSIFFTQEGNIKIPEFPTSIINGKVKVLDKR